MFAKNVLLSLAALSLLSTTVSQPAQCRSTKKATKSSTQAVPQSDEAAVRAHLTALRNYVGTGNATAMAQLWTEDGRYTDETGSEYVGRAALEKNFASTFSENGKSQVSIVPNSIHFPAGTVAVIDGTVNRDEGARLVPVTRYSIVMEKRSGQWLISSATETSISDQTYVNPLQSLEWIVGNWHAEKDGTSVNMKADWVPSHNFICCKYEIKKGTETPQVEMQVIGWDPLRQKPLSWNFDSSGGFGQGSWSHKNSQWMVESSGIEHNGSMTNSTNIYTSSDPNSFSWQSVNRRINGISVADMAPLKVQRITK